MADDLDERAAVARAMCVAHGQNPESQLSVENGGVKPMWQTMSPLAASVIAGFDALAEYRARGVHPKLGGVLTGKQLAALRLAGYEVVSLLAARPVAFRVIYDRQHAFFEREEEAAKFAGRHNVEYQGLYIRSGNGGHGR